MRPGRAEGSQGENSGLRLRLRGRASICPYCRDNLARERADCNTCAASYHLECLEELGMCATFGCVGEEVNVTTAEVSFGAQVEQVADRLARVELFLRLYRCAECDDWLDSSPVHCGRCDARVHARCVLRTDWCACVPLRAQKPRTSESTAPRIEVKLFRPVSRQEQVVSGRHEVLRRRVVRESTLSELKRLLSNDATWLALICLLLLIYVVSMAF